MRDKIAKKSVINIRALVSVALLCAGLWLVPSGIALHFASHDGATRWSHFFMSMHNTASLFFVAAAVVHVILNWKVLFKHMIAKAGEYTRFKRELLIALLGVSGLVLFAASHALFIP